MCAGWNWGRDGRVVALQQNGERNPGDSKKGQVVLSIDSGDRGSAGMGKQGVVQVGALKDQCKS